MKILAIDTSATAASVALAKENKIEGEFFINTTLTHSQTLIPMIDELMKNTNTDIDQIDAVAVNAGPGSFTGVRIGVAAAKRIAFPKNIPCISVSTLYSMAFNLSNVDCIVCAVMDARCSQVYNALFRCKDGNIERLSEDRALSLNDLADELKEYSEKIIFAGDGAVLCIDYMSNKLNNVELAPANLRMQRASSTACAAFLLFRQGKTTTADRLMPTYLRLPQAQRELKKKMGV